MSIRFFLNSLKLCLELKQILYSRIQKLICIKVKFIKYFLYVANMYEYFYILYIHTYLYAYIHMYLNTCLYLQVCVRKGDTQHRNTLKHIGWCSSNFCTRWPWGALWFIWNLKSHTLAMGWDMAFRNMNYRSQWIITSSFLERLSKIFFAHLLRWFAFRWFFSQLLLGWLGSPKINNQNTLSFLYRRQSFKSL